MRKTRILMISVLLSVLTAGSAFAAISPDGHGGVAYSAVSTAVQTQTSASGVVSPDGRGEVVYSAQPAYTASAFTNTPVNSTIYTTNYTGTTGGYYVNGTTYNAVSLGPVAGNQASTGLAQVTNPSQMNPAGSNYSSSSTVINTRRVVANTYQNTGWQYDSLGMWYLYQDGSYPVSSWRTIDGCTYHFNQGGYLEVNRWIYESNGAWYYVGSDGKLVRGLQSIDGKLYYFAAGSGQLQGPGLLLADGRYYYAGQDGALIRNTWVGGFYYGADGARVN